MIRLSGPGLAPQPQMSRELRSKSPPAARRSSPQQLHPVLRPPKSCAWGSMQTVQDATPWTIRLVRTIPKSAEQIFGLDKRLARAEIVAIQRELRTSRANNSETAHVVQVLFVYAAAPAPGFEGGMQSSDVCCAGDSCCQWELVTSWYLLGGRRSSPINNHLAAR